MISINLLLLLLKFPKQIQEDGAHVVQRPGHK